METKTLEEKARLLVEREIYHNLCQTADKMLKEEPELLLEAKNYYPQDEKGNKDEENGDYPEIFEFWAVSEFLASQLEEAGEVVFEMLDFRVWGRQTTGQAIAMDNVIEEIAKNMY